MLRDLARDVHGQLGDIDQEVQVDEQTTHAIVNARTSCPTVLLLVLGQVERELDDTEWVVNRLKAERGMEGGGTGIYSGVLP